MSLFVSEELQARQAARTSFAGALAAFLLVFLVLSQLGAYWMWGKADDALGEARTVAGSLEGRDKAIATRDGKVADVRAQLAEIRALEPVLRHRMPTAAVMAAVESTIPPELCSRRMRLSAENFDVVGSTRVARSYLLRMEGWQQKGDRLELNKWANALLTKFPQGSTLVSVDHQPASQPGELDTFTISFRVSSSGDWTRLGLTRIPMEAP